MMWLVKINLVDGEWYQCVATAEHDKDAIESAYDYFLADDFEVESVTAELFEQSLHGDIVDYEILD
jgi:hypothetical protein